MNDGTLWDKKNEFKSEQIGTQKVVGFNGLEVHVQSMNCGN